MVRSIALSMVRYHIVQNHTIPYHDMYTAGIVQLSMMRYYILRDGTV